MPGIGVERPKVPSTDREGFKRHWEEWKGLKFAWADMESSRGPSSDTTCPLVAVKVLHTPGIDDEYLGDSWGVSKGSTDACAVREILGNPGSDFKVSTVFLACWLRYWVDDEYAAVLCADVDCEHVCCVCEEVPESPWAGGGCPRLLCADVDSPIDSSGDRQEPTVP